METPKVSEKQLSYLDSLISLSGITEGLKSDIRDVEGKEVDFTKYNLIEWLEANLDVNSASVLITALENVKNFEATIDHPLELLKDMGHDNE